MDIKINLSTFRRLVRSGKNSSPIFESNGFVAMATGAISVYAAKRTKKKIFDNSFPYLSAGYVGISMGEGGGTDLNIEQAADEIEMILSSFDKSQKLEIINLVTEMEIDQK